MKKPLGELKLESGNNILLRHNAIQELANHYNSINWQLHSIMMGLHGILIAALFIQWNSKDHYLGAIVGAVGLVLIIVWLGIFHRHRLMIMKLYSELHKLEEIIDFDVHLCIKKMDEKHKKKKWKNKIMKQVWFFYIWGTKTNTLLHVLITMLAAIYLSLIFYLLF